MKNEEEKGVQGATHIHPAPHTHAEAQSTNALACSKNTYLCPPIHNASISIYICHQKPIFTLPLHPVEGDYNPLLVQHDKGHCLCALTVNFNPVLVEWKLRQQAFNAVSNPNEQYN